MRKVISFGVFLFALLALCAVAWKATWVPASPQVTNQNLQYDEQSPQFRALELKALAGSIEAADMLLDYHSKCHLREGLAPDVEPHQLRECREEVGFWTEIALENGSVTAAQRQANFLLESKMCRDIYRAEFWFRKFHVHFNSDRVFIQTVEDEIADKKKACAW
jgi:hypothetical protein